MKTCLNLGCGAKPLLSSQQERWINLDIRPGPGVDIVRDLRRGIPLCDATVDHVHADNVLEHFVSEDAIFLLNEIDRVLVNRGTALIIVPHAGSHGAFQDPTHKSFWVPRSAVYWNQTETPYGGLAVGITANLYARHVAVTGDMKTKAFVHFDCEKRVPKARGGA